MSYAAYCQRSHVAYIRGEIRPRITLRALRRTMADPQVPQDRVNEARGAVGENNQERPNVDPPPPPANDDADTPPLLEVYILFLLKFFSVFPLPKVRLICYGPFASGFDSRAACGAVLRIIEFMTEISRPFASSSFTRKLSNGAVAFCSCIFHLVGFYSKPASGVCYKMFGLSPCVVHSTLKRRVGRC